MSEPWMGGDTPPEENESLGPSGGVTGEASDYYRGRWHDLPLYGCPFCPFTSALSPEAIERHVYEAHVEPDAPSSTLLAPDGRPLYKEVRYGR